MAGRPLDEAAGRRGGNQRIPRPQGWTAGRDAPWLERAGPLSVDDVVGAVARRPQTDHIEPGADFRSSAVLVVIGPGPHGAEVLLTRRSTSVSSHRGEISFPGGRVDPGETFEIAALREAHEEVALDPAAVALVGRLDPISTMVSRSYIVPVVASASERPGLWPAAAEVDRILWVPLADLTHADTFREEVWPFDGAQRPIFFFELDDETVWGATARVLHQLLRVALGIEGPEPPAL